MSQTLRNMTNTVLHVADSLRPGARRRDVPVKRLVCDLLDRIVADQLTGAILDDGDLPSPWKAPRRATRTGHYRSWPSTGYDAPEPTVDAMKRRSRAGGGKRRSFDSLDRSFQVPDDVEEDKIAARHCR